MNWKLSGRILENSWTQSFTWRGDIVFYRMWDVIVPVSQMIVWTAVFSTTATFAGYTKETMLSYVLMTTLFLALSRNWALWNIGQEIREGKLNQYLVKPLSYVSYQFWMGIGRTLLATIFAMIVITTLICIFRQSLFFPDIGHFVLAFAVSVVSFFLNLLLSIFFGLFAFWLTSMDGFSDAMVGLRDVFSGGAFPIDLAGAGFVFASRLLPFAYTGYIPSQIFLEKMSIRDGFISLGIEFAWIALLLVLIKIEWKYGVKNYEGIGI